MPSYPNSFIPPTVRVLKKDGQEAVVNRDDFDPVTMTEVGKPAVAVGSTAVASSATRQGAPPAKGQPRRSTEPLDG